MKELVINVSPLETRIALLEDKRLAELQVERQENRSIVGNIYKGRVDSIVPGIQAAFIDIGFEKNGFLYVSDIAGTEGTGDFVIEDGVAKFRGAKGRPSRHTSIENLLKKNQYIMVQVAKDRLGTKGVRLTNFITLPGRYMVLMPTVTQLGVSRKIESDKERERLKTILQSIRPKGIGLITRTAGEGRKKTDFQGDVKYLTKVWDQVKAKMENAGPCLLHEDLNPILRVIRDTFTSEVEKLTIDSSAEYERIQFFLDAYAPTLNKRCKLYEDPLPIFDEFNIEPEIEKALRRKVHLKSGGYLCIDQTEALVAIDVNTGKFTGKTRLEETVFRTNLEAAEEIARQVRLRDMGGIIVIDFIDMEVEKNRRELLRVLKEALKPDRAKTTISEISELGMIEMTRKRVKHNLIKALSQPCPYCEGSGMVRSVTTVTFDTLRRLESRFCRSTRDKSVIVQAHPDVATRLQTENRPQIDDLAKQFQREIVIEPVSDFHIHDTKVLNAKTRKEISF